MGYGNELYEYEIERVLQVSQFNNAKLLLELSKDESLIKELFASFYENYDFKVQVVHKCWLRLVFEHLKTA